MSANYEAQCRGRMWGVFRREGLPNEAPVALFASIMDAIHWRRQKELYDESILRADAYISYHNGPPHNDPKAEFEDFTPKREDR